MLDVLCLWWTAGVLHADCVTCAGLLEQHNSALRAYCGCLCVAIVGAEVLGSLSDWAVVTSGPAANDAELQVTAILNPLTREAQRLSQVR